MMIKFKSSLVWYQDNDDDDKFFYLSFLFLFNIYDLLFSTRSSSSFWPFFSFIKFAKKQKRHCQFHCINDDDEDGKEKYHINKDISGKDFVQFSFFLFGSSCMIFVVNDYVCLFVLLVEYPTLFFLVVISDSNCQKGMVKMMIKIFERYNHQVEIEEKINGSQNV